MCMKVYEITSKEFKEYGRELVGYDFKELFSSLSRLYIPDKGITYEASVDSLENNEVFEEMRNRGFGGMPIEVGYVGGYNKTLNCLEYHKSSEFNIALDDVILVLGLQRDIDDGRFDTSLCKAFYVPAGCGVELYGTTLHYAPMNVGDAGYRVACVLPLGTNGDKPNFTEFDAEDRLCAGANKWIMAHPDSPEAKKGGYVGLFGENIKFSQLIF